MCCDITFDIARSRAETPLARVVRDQEVGGSNPLAPIDNQMLDSQLELSSILLRSNSS